MAQRRHLKLPLRPGSGRPGAASFEKPLSRSSPLEKFGPLWQLEQFPLPTKIFAPRCAASE